MKQYIITTSKRDGYPELIARSYLNKLNRVGDKASPCFTPHDILNELIMMAFFVVLNI